MYIDSNCSNYMPTIYISYCFLMAMDFSSIDQSMTKQINGDLRKKKGQVTNTNWDLINIKGVI